MRTRSTADGRLDPKPYLREVALRTDKPCDRSQYPFNIGAISRFEGLRFHRDITLIVGENGVGKSTLLEAIAIALGMNAEGGSRNFTFSTRASHSDLYQHLRLVRSFRRPSDMYFFRAESFFNLATNIEELDSEPSHANSIINAYGGLSLHEQSHGQSFLSLLMNRFGGRGLYLLDEPESSLSPMTQLLVRERLRELTDAGSQFIIATHSPILMAFPRADLYLVDHRGLKQMSYKETPHYQMSREFYLET